MNLSTSFLFFCRSLCYHLLPPSLSVKPSKNKRAGAADEEKHTEPIMLRGWSTYSFAPPPSLYLSLPFPPIIFHFVHSQTTSVWTALYEIIDTFINAKCFLLVPTFFLTDTEHISDQSLHTKVKLIGWPTKEVPKIKVGLFKAAVDNEYC